MKKILLITILVLAMVINVYPQVKANFYLDNARHGSGLFLIDLYVTVPAGQTWQAGPTNVRIDYYTVPASAVTYIEDNPVQNANSNLSNNTNYAAMTTTSIVGGSATSLNILLLYGKTPYTLNEGNHLLGTLRYNLVNENCCIYMLFKLNSAIFNNLTSLTYGSEWTRTNPPPYCPTNLNWNPSVIPDEYELNQNYPNPFNPTTKIRFDIPKIGFVSLRIYDMLGREVAVLVNEQLSAGSYIFDFDGSYLSSGLYYYRIETGDYSQVRKMILMK